MAAGRRWRGGGGCLPMPAVEVGVAAAVLSVLTQETVKLLSLLVRILMELSCVQPTRWLGPDSPVSSAAVELHEAGPADCGSDVGGREGLQQAQGHFGIGGIGICK
jgi:hypothetical protein